jgi:hypothetical protein
MNDDADFDIKNHLISTEDGELDQIVICLLQDL